jgi:hypothetical protein
LWDVLLPTVAGVLVLAISVYRSPQGAVWRYWPIAMILALIVALLPPLYFRDWQGSPWHYLFGIAILAAFAVSVGAAMAWILARAGVRPSGRAAGAVGFGLAAAIAGPFLLLVFGCLWFRACV